METPACVWGIPFPFVDTNLPPWKAAVRHTWEDGCEEQTDPTSGTAICSSLPYCLEGVGVGWASYMDLGLSPAWLCWRWWNFWVLRPSKRTIHHWRRTLVGTQSLRSQAQDQTIYSKLHACSSRLPSALNPCRHQDLEPLKCLIAFISLL